MVRDRIRRDQDQPTTGWIEQPVRVVLTPRTVANHYPGPIGPTACQRMVRAGGR